jgi:hypothetical protein
MSSLFQFLLNLLLEITSTSLLLIQIVIISDRNLFNPKEEESYLYYPLKIRIDNNTFPDFTVRDSNDVQIYHPYLNMSHLKTKKSYASYGIKQI